MININDYIFEKLKVNSQSKINNDNNSLVIVICYDDTHDEQYNYNCIKAFWYWLKENDINDASMRHNWKEIDKKYGEGTYDCIDVDADKYWKLTKNNSYVKTNSFKISIENDGQYVEVSDNNGHVVHINCYKYDE